MWLGRAANAVALAAREKHRGTSGNSVMNDQIYQRIEDSARSRISRKTATVCRDSIGTVVSCVGLYQLYFTDRLRFGWLGRASHAGTSVTRRIRGVRGDCDFFCVDRNSGGRMARNSIVL